MFDSVLVANRGEIAVRVIRTLRAMGIRPVAVYSDADAAARHVAEADVAVRLGPAPAAQSYLSVDRVLDAAARTGAQAVHPGYGFLAENAGFARACAGEGLVFVGPPPEAIEVMGDKIRAKATVAAAGVPVVPGSDAAAMSDGELRAAAERIGYPVLLKPSSGGGGKGMRQVGEPAALAEEVAAARREARGAFGDDTLLVERYLERPRHIEIQIMADAHGGVVHLGERECSLQRRHQKVIEEAPSPLLHGVDGGATRARLAAAAVAAARAVGYTGAGTVEFLIPAASACDGVEFFFLEMNTRLQVEHPVTELVTGLDLVELQLRVAAGEPLPLRQADVRVDGHAIQARIYAETVSLRNGSPGLLPTGGRVLALAQPQRDGVRVDSGLRCGTWVEPEYDPLLAKVIAPGRDRRTALRRLDAALADTVVLGVGTNIGFLRDLLADPDVAAGRLDTGLVQRRLEELAGGGLPEDIAAAAALVALLRAEPQGPVVDPFELPGGWRLGEPAWVEWRVVTPGHDAVAVYSRGRAHDAEIAVGDREPASAQAAWDGPGGLLVSYRGVTARYTCALDGEVVWLGRGGRSWPLREQPPLDVAAGAGSDAGGLLLAPMPGTVTAVAVAAGQPVTTGQRLLVLEGMKMEHVVVAPVDGVVRELRVGPGQTVAMSAPLVTVQPSGRE